MPIAWFVLLALLRPTAGAEPALVRHSFEHGAMGTTFHLVLYAADPGAAAAAARDVFARIDHLEDVLSDYDPRSELSRLSRSAGSGTWVAVSEDLWITLVRADSMARATRGAFDLTVGPLTQLWRWASRRQMLPDPQRVATARQAVGFRLMELDPATRRARLAVPGMRLDAGAIGKGLAADAALAVLRAAGITRALVDAGGDVLAGDPPPGADGWRVEIPSITAEGGPATTVVRIAHAAVATSGDTYRYFEMNGVRYSHLIDPTSGLGLTTRRVVTVVAPAAWEADAFTSALSVLGPAAGFRVLCGRPGTAGRVLEHDGTRWRQLEAGSILRIGGVDRTPSSDPSSPPSLPSRIP